MTKTPPIPTALDGTPNPVRLTGVIDPGRPLLVLAIEEEAQFLDTSLPVVLTGLGKANAATALAAVLARGPLPSYVVNLGTAGALVPGWTGTHRVGTVVQHDLDSPTLRTPAGDIDRQPLRVGDPAGPTLATGDSFLADEAARTRIAAYAQLVDMEGYALATAARRAGVPLQIVKHVSDDAGEGAAKVWQDTIAQSARALADWAAIHIHAYN